MRGTVQGERGDRNGRAATGAAIDTAPKPGTYSFCGLLSGEEAVMDLKKFVQQGHRLLHGSNPAARTATKLKL